MPRVAREVPWLETRDGVYYVLWYVKGRTRRFSLRTRSSVEAQSRYVAFLREGSEVYSGHDGLTVGEALGDYEREHVMGVVRVDGRDKPRMVDRERTLVCLSHLRRHLGDRQVSVLGVVACETYLADRRSDPRSPSDSTVRRELGILVAAINHEVKRERVDFNTKKLELPKGSEPRSRWLTYEELDRLRAAAATRNPLVRDLIEIAYYTASRVAAVERLSVFQVRLAENQIALAKPDEIVTKKRRPVVPIDKALRPVIERLYHEAVSAGREALLPGAGQILGRFKRVAKAAGLQGVTPHTLRHTRATHLLQGGGSIWEVAKLLGDTVDTVDKTYGHHCTDAVSRLLETAGRSKKTGA